MSWNTSPNFTEEVQVNRKVSETLVNQIEKIQFIPS